MYNSEGYRRMYADEVQDIIADTESENERLKDRVKYLENLIEEIDGILDNANEDIRILIEQAEL